MKFIKVLFAITLMLLPVSAIADENSTQNDGDTVVSVPKRYVSAEGLTHQVQQTAPEKVSQWVGVGKEIGEATKEGLNAVVDAADKFGSTKVGTFVMVMIAWKIMAKDILGIVLGIPILIGGTILWWQVMRRFFFGYQVLEKKEGHTKTYRRQEPYKFSASEARSFCGAICWLTFLAFLCVMGTIIF